MRMTLYLALFLFMNQIMDSFCFNSPCHSLQIYSPIVTKIKKIKLNIMPVGPFYIGLES